MVQRFTHVLMMLAIGLLTPPSLAQTAGDVLPAFTKGGLDIHHINTGAGSAAFLALPDGTTLLIDCGDNWDTSRPPKYKAPLRPDDSRLSGEWIARYIKKVHPRGEAAPIDYAVISHFHADHMGGLAELFRHVRVNTLLDRGWPDYQSPVPFAGPLAVRYRVALKDQMERHGMSVARFKAGVADQVTLRYESGRFRDFEVRHLAVNGEVWTGHGTDVRSRIPESKKTNENGCSAALRVRYGLFDYFTGGDLLGASAAPDTPAWRDIESSVAWVTGPVDVTVLNHHGNSDASSEFFLSVLQPRVAIAQVWAARQIDPETFARLSSPRTYPGPRDIFATNGMWDGRAEHVLAVFGESIGRRHLENWKTLAADQGHIVVRVAQGGASYNVLMLDDATESLKIRSVHGPYPSR